MRKKLVLVAAILLAAALLAGCMKSASTPPLGSNQPTVSPTIAPTQTPWVIEVTPTENVQSVVATQVAATVQAQPGTATEVPTATEEATDEATEVPTATEEPIENIVSHNWEIEFFNGATDQMIGWTQEIQNLNPELWPSFPDIDNPEANFLAANGLEYAEDESGYCEQIETCDIVVPPLHYRIVSGDYNVGFDLCSQEDDGVGCAFMMVNVGEVSTGLEDISVDFGHTIWGRYWNGDKIEQAIWAGLSHVANNMLNLTSNLNPNELPNAGGNCGKAEGCEKVRLTFFIMSGNELLIKGTTIVER